METVHIPVRETCDHFEERIHEFFKLSSISSRSDFFFFFFSESRSSFDTSSRTRHDNHNLDIRVTRSQLRNGRSPPDLVYRGKRDSSDLRHGSRGKRPAIDSGVPTIRNI